MILPWLHLVTLVVAVDPDVAAPAPSVVPPRVLDAPSAVYPLGHHENAEVDLRVLVDTTGQVAEVEISQSGGADFDAAARAAVLLWHFDPAKMAGVPFGARIRIPFVFHAPPEVDAGSVPPPDAGVAPPAVALPQVSTVPTAATAQPAVLLPTSPDEVSVRGAQRKELRGGSDIQFEVGAQAVNATRSGQAMLEAAAPGLWLANEGGAGHADQVFLRGFNAEQGQAIEFTVGGVPINEVDNTDGHGYSDTHFIIPEVVKSLRVIEGPFDPHQGDFAEAGSADYELGVTERRLQASVSTGSFNTTRLLGLWAPEGEREGTFGAMQAESSAGFGVSRAYTDASGMGQYEGELGQRGLWRFLVTAYATHFKSAGAVRADDVANGTVSFYGTEDPSQGGDAQRYTASLSLENPLGSGVATQQLFVTFRTLRLDEDFTGFLLDQQELGQSTHVQRGDGILQQYTAITPGGRGSYKLTRNILGEDQSVELGYYLRYDHTTPEIDRVRFGSQIPYLYNENLVTDVVNLAGYIDLDLHLGKRVTLRGGIRQEYFSYNVNNLCAHPEGSDTPNGELQPYQLDIPCQQRVLSGPLLANQRAAAAGLITEPKTTALFKLSSNFTVTGSIGVGAQSVDATQISQDELAPFSEITSGEVGVLYHRRFEGADLSARVVGYDTHVFHDLIFDTGSGRLSPTGSTTRTGAVAALRFKLNGWVDEVASGTYAYAHYSDGTLVPYVPNVVARSDTAVFHPLPWRLFDHPVLGKVGVSVQIVGERALPFSQAASPTVVLDGTAKLRWNYIEVGVQGQNLLNTQYPLSEFFYASYFPHSSFSYPTLTPVEHFSAAPPLTVLGTFSIILDRENG